MSRAESLWLKILGALLVLLGVVLFVSPRINYTSRKEIAHNDSIDITAKGNTTIVIPRALSLLLAAGGVTIFVLSLGKSE